MTKPIKEPMATKLIKRFYGIVGPLDEYKQHELNRIGNHCFMILTVCLLLGNPVALFLAESHPKLVAWGYPIVLGSVLFILFAYILSKTSHLTQFDKEELSPNEQQQLRHIGLKAGSLFGTGLYVCSCLLDLFDLNKPFLDQLSQPKNLIFGLLCGIFFGLASKSLVQFRQGN